MNKSVIFLIIIVLLLICSIGAYLFSNNNTLENNILTDQYPKNHSNISLNGSDISDNGSNIENNSDNITGILSNSNMGDKSNNNVNNTNYHNNINNINNNQVSPAKTTSSKSTVVKEANKILTSNKDFFGKNAVVKNVKFEGNGIWSVDFVDSKTGKKVGTTYIDDATGTMVNAM